MDRRTLLKTAAAISTAAIVPTASTGAIELVEPPAPIMPVSLKPYADYVWEWFVSHDGDVYYVSFPTKEEAVAYAKQCDYSIVAECHQQDFRLDVEGWEIIERLNDTNMDLVGEGEGIECTTEQERDLGDMVTRAVEAWTVKHGINITAWAFGGTRNKEEVELPQATGLDDAS